ncbi:MAG: hypothetical protein Q9184_000532 [Pyrenodesmia sp. 2 TL-2023]
MVEEPAVRTHGHAKIQERSSPGAKIRVDNLHYDLTEDDLEGLFTRIGPINSLALRFDRAGRSSGTAFVTYQHLSDARLAIREFDGANAHGQPIRLSLLPIAPSSDLYGGRAASTRNPFDTAERPSRSLFDRIDNPGLGSASRDRGGRSRSRSPGKPRRSDMTKPPPEGVDRPRKTQEELDKEMEDYWGPAADGQNGASAVNAGVQHGLAANAALAVVGDEDVDMSIE